MTSRVWSAPAGKDLSEIDTPPEIERLWREMRKPLNSLRRDLAFGKPWRPALPHSVRAFI
jgi:hypothetical protein